MLSHPKTSFYRAYSLWKLKHVLNSCSQQYNVLFGSRPEACSAHSPGPVIGPYIRCLKPITLAGSWHALARLRPETSRALHEAFAGYIWEIPPQCRDGLDVPAEELCIKRCLKPASTVILDKE